MKTKGKIFITTVLMLALAGSGVVLAKKGGSGGPRGGGGGEDESSDALEFNEETHLVFMREEEKLARDVYTKLGSLYPGATIFGNIDDSEQRHTDSVKAKLLQYGVTDPNTNDNMGAFTGEDYGEYFTDKYIVLTGMGAESELSALYVGALIEELDMLDIIQCPKIIQEVQDDIDEDSDCGRVYTERDDIQALLDSLLEGSKNHLRAYVGKIEAVIGDGNYVAQILTQSEVDAILGR